MLLNSHGDAFLKQWLYCLLTHDIYIRIFFPNHEQTVFRSIIHNIFFEINLFNIQKFQTKFFCCNVQLSISAFTCKTNKSNSKEKSEAIKVQFSFQMKSAMKCFERKNVQHWAGFITVTCAKLYISVKLQFAEQLLYF